MVGKRVDISMENPRVLNGAGHLRGGLNLTHSEPLEAEPVIHSADEPTRRAVLQVVGKRVDISMENPWADERPSTRIVAIGAAGGFEAKALEDAFDSCIAA